MLKAMGHNVLGYESGAEYLEALVDAPKPDCVVLDMTMPGMKGSQVFVRMRKMGCSAPVVLISGFSSRESMAHFHDELPSFFLQKPFGQEDLRLAVCRAIEAGGGDSG
jgi:FixJ family two-component response regulator